MKTYILGALLALGFLVSPVFVNHASAAALTVGQVSAIIDLLQAFGADQSVITSVQSALSEGGTAPAANTPGAPTASITVNGSHDVTLYVGDNSSSIIWNATGGTSWRSTYAASGTCSGAVATTPWVANTPDGSSNPFINSSYVGCVVTVTYTATNAVGSTSDTVRLTIAAAPVAGAPTATFTINGQTSLADVDPLMPRTWAWSSTNGSTQLASVVVSGCDDAHQNGSVNPWTPWAFGTGTAANGSASPTPGPGYYGCTASATYTVIGNGDRQATAHATVTFKHSGASSSGITADFSKTTLTSVSDSLTFTASGLDYNNAAGCLTVIAHPNASAISSATACTSPNQFTNFKDNSRWSWNATTKIWTQTWSYATMPSLFTSGTVKVQTHWRNTTTGDRKDGPVVTILGTASATYTCPSGQTVANASLCPTTRPLTDPATTPQWGTGPHHWEFFEGPMQSSPPPPICNSLVYTNGSCTIPSLCVTQDGLNRYVCHQ